MHLAVLLPLVVLPFSLAAQAKVKVGNAKGELVFDRPNVVAGKGDTIEFTFYPMNHSVAQSTFDKPCEPLDNGIFSGFFPVKDGTAVSCSRPSTSTFQTALSHCHSSHKFTPTFTDSRLDL